MSPFPFLDLEPWPQGSFHFETPLPGSKSLTLRDCAIAALADGTSTIRYPGECDDYWRMKDCLRRLGITVDDSMEDVVRITGRGGEFLPGALSLKVANPEIVNRCGVDTTVMARNSDQDYVRAFEGVREAAKRR